MLSVKFLPQVDQGFYTVDCSESPSAFYAPQMQALIAYLRSLGYRSSKLTVDVGAITLGQRNNASDVARVVRAISATSTVLIDYKTWNINGLTTISQFA